MRYILQTSRLKLVLSYVQVNIIFVVIQQHVPYAVNRAQLVFNPERYFN